MNKASEIEAGEVIGAGIPIKQFDPEVAKRIKASKKQARQRKVARSTERAASEHLRAVALGHFVVQVSANNQDLREVVTNRGREVVRRHDFPEVLVSLPARLPCRHSPVNSAWEVVRQHRREDQLKEEQPRRSCEQEGEVWADRIIRQSSAAATSLPRKKQT